MKFDIKDVKSWANRHDVKVGDSGYVSNDLDVLRDDLKSGIAQIRIISHVGDNDAYCFSCKAFGATRNYGFFLPADAVKKEKEYRPFKDLYEFHLFLLKNPFTKKEFRKEFLLRFSFTYREKAVPQIATTVVITRIDVGLDNDPCLTFINRRDLIDWFDNYEIMNSKGEWVPFGVEIEDE